MAYNLPLQEPYQRRGGLADNVQSVDVPVASWRDGVVLHAQCDQVGFLWNCGRHLGDPKPVAAPEDGDLFLPTVMGSASSCTTPARSSLIGNRPQQIAERSLESIVRWNLLAQLLYDGVRGEGEEGDENPNPGLIGSAAVLDSQDYAQPSSIAATLEGMFDANCSRWSEPALHVPQQFRWYFIEQGLVTYADGVYRIGDLRVIFDCFPNVAPDAATEDDVPAGAFWMYLASRPIVMWDSVTQADALDARQNEYTALAERGVIAMFEPCSVVAAMASVYPTPAGTPAA